MRINKIKTTTTIIIKKKKSLADHSDTYRLETVAEIGDGGVPNEEDLDPIPSDIASQMHDEGGVGVGVIPFFEP